MIERPAFMYSIMYPRSVIDLDGVQDTREFTSEEEFLSYLRYLRSVTVIASYVRPMVCKISYGPWKPYD